MNVFKRVSGLMNIGRVVLCCCFVVSTCPTLEEDAIGQEENLLWLNARHPETIIQ